MSSRRISVIRAAPVDATAALMAMGTCSDILYEKIELDHRADFHDIESCYLRLPLCRTGECNGPEVARVAGTQKIV